VPQDQGIQQIIFIRTVWGLGAYRLALGRGLENKTMQMPLLIAGAGYVITTSVGLFVVMAGMIAFFFPG